MPKPIVQIRNARVIPATFARPHNRWSLDAMVLTGDYASKHPVFGEGGRGVITSLIVEQRLSKREVETLNTIYQLVD